MSGEELRENFTDGNSKATHLLDLELEDNSAKYTPTKKLTHENNLNKSNNGTTIGEKDGNNFLKHKINPLKPKLNNKIPYNIN